MYSVVCVASGMSVLGVCTVECVFAEYYLSVCGVCTVVCVYGEWCVFVGGVCTVQFVCLCGEFCVCVRCVQCEVCV